MCGNFDHCGGDGCGGYGTCVSWRSHPLCIPGLPHSVVKHAESSRVRELIQKIENHPDRHALQQIYDKTKPTTRSVQSLNG